MTVYEIIDGLIDVSQVLPEKQKGEGYESARKLIHDEFATAEDVEVGCYHEAGHWTQAILSANQLKINPSGIKVIGPGIKYYGPRDGKPERYDAFPLKVEMDGIDDWRAEIEDDVRAIARIAVAWRTRPTCPIPM